MTDHLGSVRAIVTDNAVAERSDYYPFGGRHDNPSLTTLTSNRYGFIGKERQNISSSLDPYIDFGARFYDPLTARWLSPDPMADKYTSLTQYNYCGGDPVNYVDFNGRDWYTINDNGDIRFYKEDKTERLYQFVEYGPLNEKDYIQLPEKGILSELANAGSVSKTQMHSKSLLLSLFYFVSNHSSVEWGLYTNAHGSVLGTSHLSQSTATSGWKAFLDERPTEKIHSHPNTGISTKEEYDSMGYWLDNKAYDNNGALINPYVRRVPMGDWATFRDDFEEYGQSVTKSRIYFPNSKRTYQLRYDSCPYLIQ